MRFLSHLTFINMSVQRTGAGHPLYPARHETFVSEDTSFVAGDSPATLDVNATLRRNANQGHIINDGAGDFTVQISVDGTNYGTAFTMKAGEVYDLAGENVDSIRITHGGTNSSYRVMAK